MSEGDLVALAVAGDSAAFGALVRQHQSRLRGFMRRLTRGDHALADDLAQETFLEAWRKIAQYRGEGAFAAWLSQIAYRRFLMTVRRRQLEPLGAEAEEMTNVSPDDRLDLERAMARLPLAQRAALTICHALGYTNEEASVILDMPVGTVKSHVARGRQRLRELLEAH